jgi:hypothetical protein
MGGRWMGMWCAKRHGPGNGSVKLALNAGIECVRNKCVDDLSRDTGQANFLRQLASVGKRRSADETSVQRQGVNFTLPVLNDVFLCLNLYNFE